MNVYRQRSDARNAQITEEPIRRNSNDMHAPAVSHSILCVYDVMALHQNTYIGMKKPLGFLYALDSFCWLSFVLWHIFVVAGTHQKRRVCECE